MTEDSTTTVFSSPSTIATLQTPRKGDNPQLSYLSREEIVRRVLELEQDLEEFQESSKELESALEEELNTLEADKERLSKEVNIKNTNIKHLNSVIKSLKTEINQLNDKYNDEKMKADNEIRTLKQKLVEIEIMNDNMESNDRLISNKLESLNQFNMELIEKMALLENDLHLEKKQNTEKNLHIINYENTINDLKNRIALLEARQSSDDSDPDVDILYLSMKDVLRAGPPVSPQLNKAMKKSDSSKMIYEMMANREGLNNKFKDLRRDSLQLTSPMKSSSTTQVSNLNTEESNTVYNNKPNRLEKSKSSKGLTKMLEKEANNNLETIPASPTTSLHNDSKNSHLKRKKSTHIPFIGWLSNK